MALDSQTIPDGPIWARESVTNRTLVLGEASGAVWCHIQAGPRNRSYSYPGGSIWSFLGSFFEPLFGHFLDHFWGPFWGPFSDQIGQRGTKMSPRGPSRASKTNKATFSKKWFSRKTVCIFSLLRPPKRTSRSPRRRGTQRTPKPQKKGSKIDPIINRI